MASPRKRETWAERKARELAKYGETPGNRRAARERAAGKARDYELERERREIRARGKGLPNARAATRYRKATGIKPGQENPRDVEAFLKADVLKRFGLTPSGFDRMRRENRRWSHGTAGYPSHLEQLALKSTARADAILNHAADQSDYSDEIDAAVHDWSDERIGYIKAFYDANVNPRTSWDTLTSNGRRLVDRKGKRPTNKAQWDYLVKFGRFMSVQEFQVRYGLTFS